MKNGPWVVPEPGNPPGSRVFGHVTIAELKELGIEVPHGYRTAKDFADTCRLNLTISRKLGSVPFIAEYEHVVRKLESLGL